ncbi:MAG: cytochrome c3 family protein [Bacteroidales bacterium]|nr:cytochrome c3 family protein [Bacteroidales bacterium]
MLASATEKHHYGISHNKMKEAERLFHGLIKTGDNTVNCASCHNTNYIDTLNWHPSAYEIAVSTANYDSSEFTNVLLDPFGSAVLEKSHANLQLTPEQVLLIKVYLTKLKDDGPIVKKRPTINKFLKLVLFALLMAVSIGAVLKSQRAAIKGIALLLLLTSLYFITELIVKEAIMLGRSPNYAPLQPVKFSHQVHAGENGTDCMYCHTGAEVSKSAGIPGLNVCLNCHILIREGRNSGKFEINKLHAALDSGHPIEWVRVHKLPDHVFFSHAQHVGVGKLDCAECHGAVNEMHVLKQQNTLSMGWCLDCHRAKKVDFLDNDYYQTFEEYHQAIAKGEIDSVIVDQIGGSDCMKCHY